MKPTVRVSIGGLAFNIEEDAYQVLSDYLQSLRKHFEGNPEADEIIADIESRLSELLQMRMSKSEGAITIEDALDTIKIMGNPKDFGDAASEETSAPIDDNEPVTDSFRKKRLFRDLDNKVIGGVCSGLGHYFKIDVTLIRLLFAALFFLLFFFRHSGPSCVIVIGVYVVLWIVMPAARTFNQKLKMTGTNPSIENIEDQPLQPIRKYRGSGLTAFLNLMLNIFVGIIAVMSFIFLIGIIGSLIWLYMDTDILGTANYMVLFGYNTFDVKLAVVLLWILPVVGFFCLMLKVLRRTSFTTATLVSFIAGLILWLGSAIYLGNKTARFVHSHQHEETVVEKVSVGTPADRLYVKLGNEYIETNTQPNVPVILYKGDKLRDRNICILPDISFWEDSTLTAYEIEIHKKNFGENDVVASRKAENMRLDYSITDSLLTINPEWYNNDKSWSLERYEIKIKTPKGKEVELATPLQDRYHVGSFRVEVSDRGIYNCFWLWPWFVYRFF